MENVPNPMMCSTAFIYKNLKNNNSCGYRVNKKIFEEWNRYKLQGSYYDRLLIVSCADVCICMPHISSFPLTAKFSYTAQFQLSSSLDTNNGVAADGFL